MAVHWSPGPAMPRLDDPHVHLWLIDLACPDADLEALERVLSPEERAHAARYHFARDRRAYLVARARLRAILSRYTPIAPEALRFVLGPQGKPALAPAAVSFNLSHSGRWALLAVTPSARVGVDIEALRPLDELEAIARGHFSPREQAALLALPAAERLAGFFRLWTRKEAYIKALGGGLSIPLESFEVSLAPDHARLERVLGDAEAPARWHLAALAPASGYVGALAVEAPAAQLTCWRFSD